MLVAMAGLGAGAPTPYAASWYLTPELLLAGVAGIIGSMPVVPALAPYIASRRTATSGHDAAVEMSTPWALGAAVALAVLLLASMTQVAAGSFSPFIYFRF
jgi:hypothetical protein